MKQVVVTAPHTFEIQEVPIPVPTAGEVLIKMKAASVCGSDYHNFLGENPQLTYPRILGHENAGIIEAVGLGVTKLKEGDHVVVDIVIACGTCPQCKSGRRNICKTVKARGSAIDGGWREYFCVPEHEVFVIPDEIPFEDAALVEPFAIGEHTTKRAAVKADDVVLVFGTGTIGAIILQACKEKKARVICADIDDRLLNRALQYGADFVINTKKEDLVGKIQKITNGNGVDVIFDAACFPGSLTMIMQPGVPTNGARIMPLGFCNIPEKVTQAMINGRELTLIGSRMSADQFEPTIKKFCEGKVNLKGMVSHYISFGNIGEVFHMIEHPPSDLRKMVILFDQEERGT